MRPHSLTVLAARALLVLTLFMTAASHAADKREQALAYLERMRVQSGVPGMSAAVAVNGTIVFSGGAGFANLEQGAPQDGTTVHNIGSVSKTLAVVAVMQLVERRKVDLDAQIQTYLPWFPRKQQPITLRQILTHTSGIRHYQAGEFGEGDVQQ